MFLKYKQYIKSEQADRSQLNMTLNQVTLSPPIMKISKEEPKQNVLFRGHPTKYRIQCKSFTENYKLDKLCYLSNSDMVSEEALSALELIKEEGI